MIGYARPAALLLGLIVLGAGTHAAAARPLGDLGPAHASPAASVISHVVFIVQENRSFNNLFLGYKGATTQKFGYSGSQKINLTPMTLAATCDIDHSHYAFFAAYDNGKNDGWDSESQNCGTNYPYRYVQRSDVSTYWDMAKQYVLADEMFQSHIDGSFIAHQYAIAAYANHEVDFPSSSWGCEGGPSDTVPTLTQQRTIGPRVAVCEDYQTFGDLLDTAGISWRFYTPSLQSWNLWSAYSAINHIYQNGNGPDWKANVISPETNVVNDIKGGTLAGMTWIVPSWQNSDHAGSGSSTGPSWVASIVNAVGESAYWKSTAIFIVWDDWGGWYDPVLPVYEDYDGLGYRIGCLMISPYAVKGSVTHTQYEMSSILRFAEDIYGTGQLAASDARANDPANDPTVFDFSQKPRKFKPFTANADWRRAGSATPSLLRPPPHFHKEYGD